MKKQTHPKKSLAQHFLKSPWAARALVQATRVSENDTVVEIGPGKGMVTKELLRAAKKVIAIEKDTTLFDSLEKKFEEALAGEKLTLIHSDILTFDPARYKLKANSYKLLGSIPYNITGAIVRRFLAIDPQPHTVGLIVQKEVAERIVERHTKRSMLSLMVSAYGSPRYIRTIKAREFSPQPKVDSAIVVIDNISRAFFHDINEEHFFILLKAGFASRRKTLLNNLKQAFPLDKEGRPLLKKAEISENARAEDLSLADWKNLYHLLF